MMMLMVISVITMMTTMVIGIGDEFTPDHHVEL